MREWMEIARKETGLTKRETAARLGISESYYSMIEKGERQQSLDIALVSKLSNVFGMSLTQIVEAEQGAS